MKEDVSSNGKVSFLMNAMLDLWRRTHKSIYNSIMSLHFTISLICIDGLEIIVLHGRRLNKLIYLQQNS